MAFMNLLGLRFLVPEGCDASLLTQECVWADDAQQRAVLARHLGVQQLTRYVRVVWQAATCHRQDPCPRPASQSPVQLGQPRVAIFHSLSSDICTADGVTAVWLEHLDACEELHTSSHALAAHTWA